MRKLGMCLAVTVLLPLFAAAQDASEILKKVAATYKGLSSYDFERIQRQDNQSNGSSNGHEYRERLAGTAGKARKEMQGATPALTIWDGRYVWRYDPVNNEYTKRPDAAPQLLSEYQGIAAGGQEARVLREETVDFETGPVLCYVVEVRGSSVSDPPPEVEQKPALYWIDKIRFLVLKQSRKTIFRRPRREAEHVSTTSLTKAVVGQPLPDALFQFNPPEGAVQVDELSPGPRSPMIGKDLAEFELKDSAGNIITNANLRGKVAILRFGDPYPEDWDPLPFIELLHRSFKGEDVVVLNFVTGGSKDQVEQLTRLGYKVPTALDPGGATAKKLGLSSGYGTILVDRGGKVLYHSNDCGSREIVRALRKAGVW